MALSERTVTECRDLAANYPQARSAILPMLHLVQSEEGLVSSDGVEAISEVLGLTTAEVRAVASFYSMYRKAGVGGEHHVGVCVNTMCGLLGGDAIFEALSDRLGVATHGTTDDGKFTIERIECQAACTYSPVVTVDWEFFDQMDIKKMMDVIDRLVAGESVESTRGPAVRGWRAAERTIAGLPDGLADQGGSADEVMLAGLEEAKRRGEHAPTSGKEAL